jgi:thioredoxin reductase (NADPH)
MSKSIKELNYDLIILGGGPAGLAASIYASRGALKTAIVDTGVAGGQVNNTLEIENYPGFSSINGFDLIENLEKHSDKFGSDKYFLQEIIGFNLVADIKTVETTEYLFRSKAVIIATGSHYRHLGVPGEKEFTGRGVSYCAVCDGAFYRGKKVAVVGGGNAAIEEAGYLTKFADTVTVIHRRDCLKADKSYQDRAFANPKLKFIWDSVVTEVKGKEKVELLSVKNVKSGVIKDIPFDGIFPFIGYLPNSELFKNQLKTDENGFILTDNDLRTSLEGVFAAGDIRMKSLRQVITAVADGAIAANTAIKYVEDVEAPKNHKVSKELC